MPCLRLALATALLVPALAANAQQTVYQWKDARGVTHYTDTPPAGAHRSRAISNRGSTPTAPAAATPAKDSRCEDARGNLERLGSGQPIGFDDDGDGKPDRNLTDQERAAQTELNQAAVKAWCGQG